MIFSEEPSVINVLIVDDSSFFRTSMSRMLTKDPEIQIVGAARDGNEAVDLVRKLKPDIVTLDIEMPRRDGLSALEEIMADCPTPVLMVSSVTLEGAEATLKALELGAMDFIPKYQGGSVAHLDLDALSTEICAKVKSIVNRTKRFPVRARRRVNTPIKEPEISPLRARINRLAELRNTAPSISSTKLPIGASCDYTSQPIETARLGGRVKRDFVAIGVSTGGPPAVQKVLSALPEDFPACICIAQHMPATFTGPFAKRLDNMSKITVKEAETGDRIQNGVAYICPGGKHLRVDMRGAMPHISIVMEPTTALYKPSANVLMESVGNSLGRRSIGVIMTGMGSDGVEGMKVLKAKGGYVVAQNEASCVVYGMPKAVVDAGLADDIVEIDNMAETIVAALYK